MSEQIYFKNRIPEIADGSNCNGISEDQLRPCTTRSSSPPYPIASYPIASNIPKIDFSELAGMVEVNAEVITSAFMKCRGYNLGIS